MQSVLVRLIFIISATLSICGSAVADYSVTGPITGAVCKGFGIKSCSFHKVEAVKGDDGRMHSVKTVFEHVSEYDKSKGLCWVNTKSRGGGILSWGINAAIQPEFYEKTASGEYQRLDVDYITFPCFQLPIK